MSYVPFPLYNTQYEVRRTQINFISNTDKENCNKNSVINQMPGTANLDTEFHFNPTNRILKRMNPKKKYIKLIKKFIIAHVII